MENIDTGGYNLRNLNKINVIMGKNGVGKSTLLRHIEQSISSQTEEYGKPKYITPERGGDLSYNATIEQNMTIDRTWLSGERRKNQSTYFRSQSVNQYMMLELLVLRQHEEDHNKPKFISILEKINSLLDNIKIVRSDRAFKIYTKSSDQELIPTQISSGESELISLGIECLVFAKECTQEKENILFLDEPDVHLHPDLQVRLMRFLEDLVNNNNFSVFIATHSTAILGALESYSDTHIAFIKFDQKTIDFVPISETLKKVLPVFGAHPLSNIFNRAPVWLVEGDDDERVWQQVVRSSKGKIKIYPCSVVDGLSNLNDFEEQTKTIIETVYDNAKGYSLRDADNIDEEIADNGPLIRMRLACRTCENLLLSDDVLEYLNCTWNQVKILIDKWLNENISHSHFEEMKSFKDHGYIRKSHDIKVIRNDLMGIIGSHKPWEVAVGQTIAAVICSIDRNFEDARILNYLGKKTVDNLDDIIRSSTGR